MTEALRRESPLYVQLAAEFRRLVARGLWPVGDQVPTVEALARRYGVARITIRQAMDLLAQEGLVTRSRGRGTHVAKAPELLRWHKLTSPWDEFMYPARGGSSTVLEDRRATALPEITPHDGKLGGAYRFLRIASQRGTGPPMLVREDYIQTPVYQAIRGHIAQASMLELLREHIDRMTVLQEVSAAVPKIAQLLGVPVGMPVVEARHVGITRHGVIVFIEFLVLRGDYVKYEITTTRPGVAISLDQGDPPSPIFPPP